MTEQFTSLTLLTKLGTLYLTLKAQKQKMYEKQTKTSQSTFSKCFTFLPHFSMIMKNLWAKRVIFVVLCKHEVIDQILQIVGILTVTLLKY